MSRAISSVIDSPITPMVQYKFKLKYKYKYKYRTNTKQIQNKYRTNTNTNEQIHMTHYEPIQQCGRQPHHINVAIMLTQSLHSKMTSKLWMSNEQGCNKHEWL